MKIQTKRIYEERSDDDGLRVLVDRLWPRGVSKEKAGLDEWFRDIAPTDELRKRFHDLGPDSFGQFSDDFRKQLEGHRDELEDLLKKAHDSGAEVLTLLYSFHDEEHNNAVVIAEVLRELDA